MFFSTLKTATPYKFRSDLWWNLGGFGIIAVCGLLINLLITHYYGFSSLGFFNLLLVFFLVLSQLFSWGLPLSVQKFVPQYRSRKKLCKQLLTSALVVTGGLALAGVTLLYLVKELPGTVMDNPLLRKGFVHLIAGIGFSVISRIFLSFQNGMRFMKIYAFFNAFRVLLMLLVLILLLALKIKVEYLGLIFTVPEILLAILLYLTNRKWLTSMETRRFLQLSKLHLRYGNRGVLGSVVTSFQTKIDVFILGFFVSNTLLGVYSFAVFVADGFFQIFYVFRVIINPVITNMYYDRSPLLLKRFIHNSIRRFYRIFHILGLLLAIFYPAFLYFFGITDHLTTNLFLFYILLLGVMIGSGYVPFQFFFNQTGQPKAQTNFLLALFSVTGISMLVLVPGLGVFGAALALIFSNLFQILYLQQGIRSSLKKK